MQNIRAGSTGVDFAGGAALALVAAAWLPGAAGAQDELFSSTGEAGSHYGWAVTRAGDADGDGRQDLLIGGDGVEVTVRSGADHGILYQIPPPTPGGLFGRAVAPIGDVDGDLVEDVVVGASAAGGAGQGEVYVYSGASGALLLSLIHI